MGAAIPPVVQLQVQLHVLHYVALGHTSFILKLLEILQLSNMILT